MTCRLESTQTQQWRFCTDAIPAVSDRMRAIVRARLVDELSGEPIAESTTLSTAIPGLHPRIGTDGLVGLVGRPARLFPTLDVAGVMLSVRISAQSYGSLDLEVPLGPMPGFPASFTPLDLGDVFLHRRAVGLSGRTVRRLGLATTVVAGATVEVAGYWPRVPTAGVNAAAVMEPPHLLALAPPLYGRCGIGSSTVTRRDLSAVSGMDKTLLAPAAAGERRVRLTDRIGLTSNGVLTIDAADPARREHLLISTIETTSSSDQASWISLAHPLAYAHQPGTLCQPAILAAAGSLIALTRDGLPGDVTIFTASLTGLSDNITVEIDSGLGAAEYHEARIYRIVSDTGGFFRLPPIQRVAMVALHSSKSGLASPADKWFAPDYRHPDQYLTLSFPP